MATGEKNEYVPKGMIGLLWIEPVKEPFFKPIIDSLTKKMTTSVRGQKTPPDHYFGWHRCKCGAKSETHDVYLNDDIHVTNSLAVHYLAFHRDEIPEKELEKVRNLKCSEEEPNEDELQTPKPIEPISEQILYWRRVREELKKESLKRGIENGTERKTKGNA